MKHYKVHFRPDDKKVTIHRGATLWEAAGLAGVNLSSPCGGLGRCGKCVVQLLPSGKKALACQYRIEHDVNVFVPDSSRFFKQKILEHGVNQNIFLNPAVQKIFVSETFSGLNELCKILAQKLQTGCVSDDTVENTVSQSGVTAVLVAAADSNSSTWRLIALEAGDTAATLFGTAVDIGTTTVVLQLVNLRTGEVAATVSTSNPQTQYGADVISRIRVAETTEGMETLHQSIISCLNTLIREAAQAAAIEPTAIYEMVIAGNTTMNHLLLRYPVRQLGQAPYLAHSLAPTNHKAAQLGLCTHPAGNVHTLANVAGFVGADTTAGALACGMDITDAITLLVDIGTNGEIILGTKNRLLAASCAAGPALEGAGIEFGSRAQDGAIERVVRCEHDIDVDVIGNVRAVTICGSGLIDAVAVMLDAGIVDTTGRFIPPDELYVLSIPEKIKKQVISWRNEPAFLLAGKYHKGVSENAVVLTQKDIRQVQLAKAAIQAGVLLLLKNAGYDQSQIQQVLLAGAFGNYIQKENAVRIGLLPYVPMEKIHFVGNAAGCGAQMALVSRMARAIAEQLARKIQYLEIAHQTEFQKVFSDCLLFPSKSCSA